MGGWSQRMKAAWRKGGRRKKLTQRKYARDLTPYQLKKAEAEQLAAMAKQAPEQAPEAAPAAAEEEMEVEVEDEEEQVVGGLVLRLPVPGQAWPPPAPEGWEYL